MTRGQFFLSSICVRALDFGSGVDKKNRPPLSLARALTKEPFHNFLIDSRLDPIQKSLVKRNNYKLLSQRLTQANKRAIMKMMEQVDGRSAAHARDPPAGGKQTDGLFRFILCKGESE